MGRIAALSLILSLAACAGAQPGPDGGSPDGGSPDGGSTDGGSTEVQRATTVTFSGSGTGKVTGHGVTCTVGDDITPCVIRVVAAEPPSTVTLTSTASEGSTFAGWSGACQGVGTTCELTVATDLSVGVAFEAVTQPLPATRGRASVSARVERQLGDRYALTLVAHGGGIAEGSATGPEAIPATLTAGCPWESVDCLSTTLDLGTAAPAPGAEYRFDVGYLDGTSEVLAAQVSALDVGFAVPQAPADGGLAMPAPTFNWQAPATGCASGYRVRVFDEQSGASRWVSALLPAGTTSEPYSGSTLPSGSYSWDVVAEDDCASARPDARNHTVSGRLAFSVARMSAGYLPSCAALASDPAWGLAGNPWLTGSVTASVIPSSPSYCQVDLTYSSRQGPAFGYAAGEAQHVKIRIGLPVNSLDGGSGGVGEGSWNGRTRNLGGGGCVGTVGSVAPATTTGYVGSYTDAGHSGDCTFPLVADPRHLDFGLFRDYSIDSQVAQVRWAKILAATYYQRAPAYNYWDGCSTGGRQGLALAQQHPGELDGWLVGAPVINGTRVTVANFWPFIVMEDLVGGFIAPAKIDQAAASLVSACDGLDGAVDGILADPRKCTFSAASNVCGKDGAPATNCLTTAEAQAIDLFWDGPRNAAGLKVFAGKTRGALLNYPASPPPDALSLSTVQWANQAVDFDWAALRRSDYAAQAELASNLLGDMFDAISPALEPVRDGGKKILMWHGTADQRITFESSLDYYVRVAGHFGNGEPDFAAIQPWFRYVLAPGVAHCGSGAGPQPQQLFGAMVSWVEQGTAPDGLVASKSGMTRPLCSFPQTAVYKGGDQNVAASFHCEDNLQTQSAIQNGRYVRYQHETGDELGTYGGPP